MVNKIHYVIIAYSPYHMFAFCGIMFCAYDTIGYVSFKKLDIYNTHFLRLSFLDIQ
jgi:hypothetical protein